MSYDSDREVFEYTHKFTANSSFIASAAYDADSQELVVFLDNDRSYLYHNVPLSVYRDFEVGKSTNWLVKFSQGRFYNSVVKKQYGPAAEIDLWDDEIVEKSVPAADMSDVTKAEPVNTTSSNGYSVQLTANSSAGVERLTQLHNATFSLSIPETKEESVQRTHVVHFTVEGGNDVKTYSVEAGSVSEAVDALSKATDALGLDINVKGVYVSFE